MRIGSIVIRSGGLRGGSWTGQEGKERLRTRTGRVLASHQRNLARLQPFPIPRSGFHSWIFWVDSLLICVLSFAVTPAFVACLDVLLRIVIGLLPTLSRIIIPPNSFCVFDISLLFIYIRSTFYLWFLSRSLSLARLARTTENSRTSKRSLPNTTPPTSSTSPLKSAASSPT